MENHSMRRSDGIAAYTDRMRRKSEKVGKIRRRFPAVEKWRKSGVEKKTFLKILWRNPRPLFHNPLSVKSPLSGKSGNMSEQI